ncbi:hypothetical protein BGZ95_005411 [Linnemannia exigua]|uniref:Invertebrate defensins family profile domain-containing protein n=1 Tax=Linnemannia exigua TaxID=604196 RepID=A0AAD4HAY2_9FUNG|nr:hypothetical protein BGZ95_005411 [Linnemannia exigua]
MKALNMTILALIAAFSSSSFTTSAQGMSYGCPFTIKQCIQHCVKVGYKSGACGTGWGSLNCYCSMTPGQDFNSKNAGWVLAPDAAPDADADAKVAVERPLL